VVEAFRRSPLIVEFLGSRALRKLELDVFFQSVRFLPCSRLVGSLASVEEHLRELPLGLRCWITGKLLFGGHPAESLRVGLFSINGVLDLASFFDDVASCLEEICPPGGRGCLVLGSPRGDVLSQMLFPRFRRRLDWILGEGPQASQEAAENESSSLRVALRVPRGRAALHAILSSTEDSASLRELLEYTVLSAALTGNTVAYLLAANLFLHLATLIQWRGAPPAGSKEEATPISWIPSLNGIQWGPAPSDSTSPVSAWEHASSEAGPFAEHLGDPLLRLTDSPLPGERDGRGWVGNALRWEFTEVKCSLLIHRSLADFLLPLYSNEPPREPSSDAVRRPDPIDLCNIGLRAAATEGGARFFLALRSLLQALEGPARHPLPEGLADAVISYIDDLEDRRVYCQALCLTCMLGDLFVLGAGDLRAGLCLAKKAYALSPFSLTRGMLSGVLWRVAACHLLAEAENCAMAWKTVQQGEGGARWHINALEFVENHYVVFGSGNLEEADRDFLLEMLRKCGSPARTAADLATEPRGAEGAERAENPGTVPPLPIFGENFGENFGGGSTRGMTLQEMYLIRLGDVCGGVWPPVSELDPPIAGKRWRAPRSVKKTNPLGALQYFDFFSLSPSQVSRKP